MIGQLERLVPRSQSELSVVQQRLIRAGYRNESAVKFFYGAKIAGPTRSLSHRSRVPVSLTSAASSPMRSRWRLAFLHPTSGWAGRSRRGRRRYAAGCPTCSTCWSSASKLDRALTRRQSRTAEELRMAQPAISDELGVVVLEQRAGPRQNRRLEALCRAHRRR